MSNTNVDKKKKKEVLFVITKGNFGGAQRYVFDLATSLPKSRFEAVVACGQGELLKERLKEENIKVLDLHSEREINLKNDWFVLKALIKTIKEEKPDIVHFNSSKIGFLGAVSVLYFHSFFPSLNFKFVFTSHGWAFNEKNRSFLSRIIYYVAHYFTVLICDTTIAVSLKTKKDIAFLPFIEKKIKVIHNGISKFETLPREEAREILAGEKKDRTIIFSTTELHNNKGIDVALRGLALLTPDLREKIVLCVAGSGEEKENLEKLTANLSLQENVRFLGFVDDAKKLLSGADIFLFPSRTENLPFAILEAGLVGLPIISTSVGGIPEIITDMQSGVLIHKESPKEIAEALKYLLNNPKRQVSFGSALKKQISKNFSKAKMVTETIGVFG